MACLAGDYNDLHEFDTKELLWTNLVSSNAPPPPRDTHGFTADSGGSGGRLFVFGGWSVTSDSEFRWGRRGGAEQDGGSMFDQWLKRSYG